jgi:hypothetical protein
VKARPTKRLILSAAILLLNVKAFAQIQIFDPIDLSGTWAAHNDEDPGDKALPGDFTGMPINDEARARADTWSASTQSMPERQCIMYSAFYTVLQPQGLRTWADMDPISGRIIAWHLSGVIDREPRTIWMDGRPHPSKYDRHTTIGFSTGEWRGNTLVVHTTHLTANLIGHTGVPSSDQAEVYEYINRHGNALIITMFLHDPIYFEEPYVRTKVWTLDPTVRRLPEPCEPAIEVPEPPGYVAHYLPGTNTSLHDASNEFGIPWEAVRGGAKTTYPEYQARLKTLSVPAPKPETKSP